MRQSSHDSKEKYQFDKFYHKTRPLPPAKATDARQLDDAIRTLARAHRWQGLLEQSKYQSAGELAEAEGVTRSFVNRLLRLTLLAPDIVEAILDGRQPKGLQLEDLTRALPNDWEEQRKRLLPPGAA